MENQQDPPIVRTSLVTIAHYPEATQIHPQWHNTQSKKNKPAESAEPKVSSMISPIALHARFSRLFTDPKILSYFIVKPIKGNTHPQITRITRDKTYVVRREEGRKNEVIYDFHSGQCALNNAETTIEFKHDFIENLVMMSTEWADPESGLEVLIETKKGSQHQRAA